MIIKECRKCGACFSVEYTKRATVFCSADCRKTYQRASASKRVWSLEDKAAYYREYRKRKPEKQKKASKNYRASHPIRALINGAKGRAKTKGLPFDLDESDLVAPTHCPVLGIELNYEASHNNDASPSLDRRTPALGYVRGNVTVISRRANILKLDVIDPEELQKVVDYIRQCVNPFSQSRNSL